MWVELVDKSLYKTSNVGMKLNLQELQLDDSKSQYCTTKAFSKYQKSSVPNSLTGATMTLL